jgi:hypothetical protein
MPPSPSFCRQSCRMILSKYANLHDVFAGVVEDAHATQPPHPAHSRVVCSSLIMLTSAQSACRSCGTRVATQPPHPAGSAVLLTITTRTIHSRCCACAFLQELWKTRTPPSPLILQELLHDDAAAAVQAAAASSASSASKALGLPDQEVRLCVKCGTLSTQKPAPQSYGVCGSPPPCDIVSAGLHVTAHSAFVQCRAVWWSAACLAITWAVTLVPHC